MSTTISAIKKSISEWIGRWNETPYGRAARTGKPVHLGNTTANPPPTGKRPPAPPRPPMPGEVILLEPGEQYVPLGYLSQYLSINHRLATYYPADERAQWWYEEHPQLGCPAIVALLRGEYQAVEKTLEGLEGQMAT